MGDWLKRHEEEFKKQMQEDAEKMMYTAQEGSLLDRIWNKERDWAEDFAHENGKYINKCKHCKHEFLGSKYRRACRQCSDNNMPLKLTF